MSKRRRGDPAPQQLVAIELDPIVWDALQDAAAQQGRSVSDLVAEIARDSLPLAIRVYVAEFYRSEKATRDEPTR